MSITVPSKVVVVNFVNSTGQTQQATLPGFDLTGAQKLLDHVLQHNLPFHAFIAHQPCLLHPAEWQGCSVTYEQG